MKKIKRKYPVLFLTGIIILSFVFFIPGCKTEDDSGGGGAYGVLYEVTGTAISLYYFTSGGQQNENSPSIPWSYSFSTDNANQTVNLGATAGGSTVYVKLYINGSLKLSDSANSGLTAMTGTYTISELLD